MATKRIHHTTMMLTRTEPILNVEAKIFSSEV